jgi:hypothetical protein
MVYEYAQSSYTVAGAREAFETMKGLIMKLRYTAALAATAGFLTVGSMTAVTVMGSTQANASGSTIESITESKVMLSSNCYETYTTAITYYTHSVTKGWVREPSPKVVKTKSETCDK